MADQTNIEWADRLGEGSLNAGLVCRSPRRIERARVARTSTFIAGEIGAGDLGRTNDHLDGATKTRSVKVGLFVDPGVNRRTFDGDFAVRVTQPVKSVTRWPATKLRQLGGQHITRRRRARPLEDFLNRATMGFEFQRIAALSSSCACQQQCRKHHSQFLSSNTPRAALRCNCESVRTPMLNRCRFGRSLTDGGTAEPLIASRFDAVRP